MILGRQAKKWVLGVTCLRTAVLRDPQTGCVFGRWLPEGDMSIHRFKLHGFVRSGNSSFSGERGGEGCCDHWEQYRTQCLPEKGTWNTDNSF